MKILCISQYYAPDVTAAAFRISESVTLLREKGHEVFVVTSYPHKSDAVLDAGADEPGVVRIPVKAVRGGGVVSYLEQYIGFSIRALFAAIHIARRNRITVIWASSPPLFVGLATLALQALFRIPVVFDVRDLWPASAVDIGKVRAGSLMERAGLWLESLIYRRSSALTCVTRSIAAHIQSKTPKPVALVYNGFLARNMTLSEASPPFPRTICYAGNLGHAQGLDLVLMVFAGLRKQEKYADCRLRLVGGGAVKDALERQAEELGIADAVEFTGVVDKKSALAHLRECGILLISLKDAKTFENAIPSKLFDCMSVGNPIVATVKGEAADILRLSGGNVAVPPGDTASLLGAFEKILDGWSEFSGSARKNVDIMLEGYSREAATDVLENVLREIAGRRIA